MWKPGLSENEISCVAASMRRGEMSVYGGYLRLKHGGAKEQLPVGLTYPKLTILKHTKQIRYRYSCGTDVIVSQYSNLLIHYIHLSTIVSMVSTDLSTWEDSLCRLPRLRLHVLVNLSKDRDTWKSYLLSYASHDQCRSCHSYLSQSRRYVFCSTQSLSHVPALLNPSHCPEIAFDQPFS